MSGDEYYTHELKDEVSASQAVMEWVRLHSESATGRQGKESFFSRVVKWPKKKNKKKDMSKSPIPIPSKSSIPIPVEERVIVKANKNAYQAKYIAKHKAKNRIKTKFKIGRYYYQRIKPKDGSPNVVIKYQCVKTIYSIKDIEVNIVIMRQLTPYDGRKFTLDRQECQKFHIKYEPGLEVWPMEINWIPEKIVKN